MTLKDFQTLCDALPGKKREALCSPALSTEKARAWIREHCGPLRSGLFEYHFAGGSPDPVMEALAVYQNPDGGFGGALEADFHLPDSTPMATSVAFDIMETIGGEESEMAVKGIRWLESVFEETRQGWFAAGPRINDFPPRSLVALEPGKRDDGDRSPLGQSLRAYDEKLPFSQEFCLSPVKGWSLRVILTALPPPGAGRRWRE